MKKLLLALFIAISLQVLAAEKQSIKNPEVNNQVELLAIVFKLAGNREYQACHVPAYSKSVDEHFEKFKNHKLIRFANELRRNESISYNAVVAMATVLDENLNPKVNFSETLPEMRWNESDATKFVKLLKKFYKDTNCKEFFRKNETLFKEVEKRFSKVYNNLDLKWYQTFYGYDADENFNPIISLGCGSGNYGANYTNPGEKKEIFCIVGTRYIDNSGIPIYKEDEILPLIVHEYSHSFVNPLIDKYKESFRESGVELFSVVGNKMRQQAYSHWEIMLYEALVRASVIKYFIDHGADNVRIRKMLNEELSKGFLWMKGLVQELHKYDSQRDKYSKLDSYMPELIKANKEFAKRVKQYESHRPKVVSIKEFKNNSENVSPQLKRITINFDKQLLGKGYSINYGRKGKIAFPKLVNVIYTNNNRSVVLEIRLQPNKEYQFVLTGKSFRTAKGERLKSCEVNFKTTE